MTSPIWRDEYGRQRATRPCHRCVTLIDEWEWLWLEAERLFVAGRTGAGPAQEAYELAVAALLYQCHGIDALERHGVLHQLVRQAGGGQGALFAIPSERISNSGELPRILGQMDLALASLRLPVVVEQTCRATSSAAADFAHLLKKKPAAPQLDRALLAECWDRTDRLNC